MEHNGDEWVVDGDIGSCRYPGTWTQKQVQEKYQNGILYDKKSDHKEKKNPA
jgi:hypothetical protein